MDCSWCGIDHDGGPEFCHAAERLAAIRRALAHPHFYDGDIGADLRWLLDGYELLRQARAHRGQAMKHHCPMCGEQWNEDVCAACGWFEGKPARYSTNAKPPKALDSIVDVVLAYKPKAKSKPARRRKRRATKIAKEK